MRSHVLHHQETLEQYTAPARPTHKKDKQEDIHGESDHGWMEGSGVDRTPRGERWKFMKEDKTQASLNRNDMLFARIVSTYAGRCTPSQHLLAVEHVCRPHNLDFASSVD